MNPILYGLMFAAGLFGGMLLMLEVGRRLGVRQLTRHPDGVRHGVGPVEGAVFGLLGLMIAFSFSGAATRFESRRQQIVTEANLIETAYRRLDLLPAAAQPAMRELFRRYLDARLEVYRKLPDIAAARVELARSLKLQDEIWTSAVATCREAGSSSAQGLLLPALNGMFEVVTNRTEAMQTHPPSAIFALLGMLSLTAALLAGSGMAASKSRNWVHIVGFAAAISITVYVIMDMEYPRFGLIRLDDADRVLITVRGKMN